MKTCKILAFLLLTLAICLGMMACNSTPKETTPGETTPEVTTPEPTKPAPIALHYAADANVSGEDMKADLAAELELPEAEGTYYIAFYLKNGLDDYAMLSNDIAFEGDGFNILHTIKI